MHTSTHPFIPPAAQQAIDDQVEYHRQLREFHAKDAEETDTEETEQETPEPHTDEDGEETPDAAAQSVHVYVPPKKPKKKRH